MSSSNLKLTTETELEARERIAETLDREARMWNKRGDDMTDTMARGICYGLANEATERAKAQRRRASALRGEK